MGWFWADPTPTPSQAQTQAQTTVRQTCPVSYAYQRHDDGATPPPACPMRRESIKALSATAPAPPSPSSSSSCSVSHPGQGPAAAPPGEQPSSVLSKLNPLNYMFRDLSQRPAPNQRHPLPTSRDESSIPKGAGAGGGNWEYPSPQQMYNALLRKGYTDTDVSAVESMVAVHNFLNEGAWSEIVEWERRFAGGWARAWQICRRGEANAEETRRRIDSAAAGGRAVEEASPTLVRFQGRPGDMTPKAAMIQAMGWLIPDKFGNEPPFDRHDWYVSRQVGDKQKEIRYVIDYYTGPPEPTGEPVFYLDVRPAMTPTGAAERLMRWGGDVWWRASGGDVREANQQGGAEE